MHLLHKPIEMFSLSIYVPFENQSQPIVHYIISEIHNTNVVYYAYLII